MVHSEWGDPSETGDIRIVNSDMRAHASKSSPYLILISVKACWQLAGF